MKVILLQDVPRLGKKDEIKEVHDGYARNFLFAKNLAKPATMESVRTLDAQRMKLQREDEILIAGYRKIVEQLKLIPLMFKVKMGEKGKAFGSISPIRVQEELKKHGIKVQKDWIEMEDHVKTSGEHSIRVKFPHGIHGEIKVIVEPE